MNQFFCLLLLVATAICSSASACDSSNDLEIGTESTALLSIRSFKTQLSLTKATPVILNDGTLVASFGGCGDLYFMRPDGAAPILQRLKSDTRDLVPLENGTVAVSQNNGYFAGAELLVFDAFGSKRMERSFDYISDFIAAGAETVAVSATHTNGRKGVAFINGRGAVKWFHPPVSDAYSYPLLKTRRGHIAFATDESRSLYIVSTGAEEIGHYDLAKDSLGRQGRFHWSVALPDGGVAVAADFSSDDSDRFLPHAYYMYFFSAEGKLSRVFELETDIGWIQPIALEDGTVVIGSETGSVYFLRPSDGRKTVFQASDRISEAPAVTKDGQVVVSSWDGNIYFLSPPDERGQVKANFIYPSGRNFLQPAKVFANGLIGFVRPGDRGPILFLDQSANLVDQWRGAGEFEFGYTALFEGPGGTVAWASPRNVYIGKWNLVAGRR